MRFQSISLLSAVLVVAAAQRVEQDDIPWECNDVCANLVSTAKRCDDSTNDDNAELQCICTAQNASTLVPNCELCVRNNDWQTEGDRQNSDDNTHVFDVLTDCNFARAMQTPSPTVVPSFFSSGGTIVSTSVTVMVTPSMNATSRASSAVSGSASTRASSGSVAAATGGAAPMQTGAAIGLGALGLAFGLL